MWSLADGLDCCIRLMKLCFKLGDSVQVRIFLLPPLCVNFFGDFILFGRLWRFDSALFCKLFPLSQLLLIFLENPFQSFNLFSQKIILLLILLFYSLKIFYCISVHTKFFVKFHILSLHLRDLAFVSFLVFF